MWQIRRRGTRAFSVILGALLWGIMGGVQAEPWPSHPVLLVVPYPPGASTDKVSRDVAHRLSQDLGQQVIVENRPGAGGRMGATQVSKAEPDGYTLLLGTNGSHGLSQLVLKDAVEYDPITDFTPITPVVTLPIVLVAHPSVPANNATELVEWIKQQPGEVAYATTGVGSPHHLAGELLNQFVDGKLNHIPYKGTGQSMTDLLGGHVPLAFSSLSTVLGYAADKRLKIIGLIEDERQAVAPEVPTLGESLPGYAVPDSWLGFFGPKGMAPELTKQINAAFVKAIMAPEVRERLSSLSLGVVTSTPDEFRQRMKDSMAAFKRIMDETGVQSQ